MKKILIVFFLLAVISPAVVSAQQSVTLSTYYPAPYGAYDRLRLVPRGNIGAGLGTVCTANEQGTLYVNNVTTPETVLFCDSNLTWKPLSGVWTQNSSNAVYLSNSTNTNLKVGIGTGTTTPAAKLTIQDGAILATGVAGPIPVQNAGTRFMWIPSLAALRAGSTNTQWNTGNIGSYSVGLGYFPLASGLDSIALGNTTKATNTSAVSIGTLSTASGYASVVLGRSSIASGTDSIALGTFCSATGTLSFAGAGGRAFANNSIAIGNTATAGNNTDVTVGENSSAIGTNALCADDGAIAIGSGAQNHAQNSIAIGPGAIAGTNGQPTTTNLSVALGPNAQATANTSIAIGTDSWATSTRAITLGNQISAIGQYSTAIGSNLSVSGNNSFGINTTNTNQTVTQNNAMAIMGINAVGIGTVSPQSTLHVSGRTGAAQVRIEADTDGSGGTDEARLLLTQHMGSDTGELGFFDSTNNLSMRINGTSVITLDEIGGGTRGVGINTTPVYPANLDINSVMRLRPRANTPGNCNAGSAGSFYVYDPNPALPVDSALCYCSGVSWKTVIPGDGGSTCLP